MLGLFGDDDPGIPAENVTAFGAALAAAGVTNDLVIYPGAPPPSSIGPPPSMPDAAQTQREVLDLVGVAVPD